MAEGREVNKVTKKDPAHLRRRPDLVLKLRTGHKPAPKSKVDVTNVVLSKPSVVPYEACLLQSENVASTSVRTPNMVIYVQESILTVLSSL